MKHLLTATLIATALASPVRADELFGYQLFTDIRTYHKDLSSADQHFATSSSYSEILVEPKIANAAFSDYWLDYHSETFALHTVMALQDMLTMDYCEAEMENWVPRLEDRFGVTLASEQWQDAGVTTHSFAADKNGAEIAVRCDTFHNDGSVELSIIWRSQELWDEINRGFDEF